MSMCQLNGICTVWSEVGSTLVSGCDPTLKSILGAWQYWHYDILLLHA